MNIKYTIIGSKRKTIAIVIKDSGEVIVKKPIFINQSTIDKFLSEKNDWIWKNVKKVIDRNKEIKRNFEHGEDFIYLGSYFKLKLVKEKIKGVEFKNNNFYINADNKKNAKELFIKFYKKQAKELLTKRVKYYINKYDFNLNHLKITSAKTRWGSCSSKKNVNLNWKLVMAPIDVIDYVIIHELTHLIHHDHSNKFWDKVEHFMPNYEEKRKWLKDSGYILNVI